jgi:hypothetical protein
MTAFRIVAPLIFLAFLAACHRPPDKKQLLAINEGLIRSFSSIQDNTDLAYASLLQRKYDVHTRYDAEKWLPIALRGKEATSSIFDYIESLKTELGQSHQLPAERTKALFDSLIQYKHSLAATLADSLDTAGHFIKPIRQDFFRHFPLLPLLSDTLFNETRFKAWADTTFDIDPVITLLALNKLKIDVALSAQMIAHFCDYQTRDEADYYTMFAPLINLNSSIVRPGEVVEVKAGIGAYTNGTEVTIGGRLTHLNEHGLAFYEFKAPSRPGKYSIPIRLEFYKPDGSKALNEQVVTYEVSALR